MTNKPDNTVNQLPLIINFLSLLIVLSILPDFRSVLLFIIGVLLGITLKHGVFGFAGAWRSAITDRDISGVVAQMLMLVVAMLLFAPILLQGQIFGHGVSGAYAPVALSMVFGALLFGLGMSFSGACASGSLFSAGGGNVWMFPVLLTFCFGCFFASLHMSWWQQFPRMGSYNILDELGWLPGLTLQLSAIVLVYAALRFFGYRRRSDLWLRPEGWIWLLRGPWPLWFSGLMLAILNWITLLTAGHPWSITWGFTLWGAKIAALLGWQPASSSFWNSGFAANALSHSIWQDTTSLMNIGIILGAAFAASLSPRRLTNKKIKPATLLLLLSGGLVMGYGARLAYGCNIGAYFSGIASGSLHGWVWIVFAIPGVILGLKFRKRLDL